MNYFLKASAISFIVIVALVWAWFGLVTLIRNFKCKRLMRQYKKENLKRIAEKYRKKNEGLSPWEKAISNNIPELIKDINDLKN